MQRDGFPSFQHCWSVNQSEWQTSSGHVLTQLVGSWTDGSSSSYRIHVISYSESPCQACQSGSLSVGHGQGDVWAGCISHQRKVTLNYPLFCDTHHRRRREASHISRLRWWSHSSNNHQHHHQRRSRPGTTSAQKKRDSFKRTSDSLRVYKDDQPLFPHPRNDSCQTTMERNYAPLCVEVPQLLLLLETARQYSSVNAILGYLSRTEWYF